MTRLKLTAIVPQLVPQTAEYIKAMEQAVLKTMKLAQQDYESTQATWKHKAKFKLTEDHVHGNYRVTTGTNRVKPYLFVDEGTRPHIIMPKRSPYLAFASGYRAKTRVGIIGSQPGGAFGPTVFAAQVHHPGFPGRKFTITISKRRQVTLTQEVSHAIALVNRTMK